MNPFRALRRAQQDYRAYVETFQRFKDESIREFVRKRSEEGDLLWKEPLVEITRQYKRGPSLRSLVDDGVLEEEVLSIFTTNPEEPNSPSVHPYYHQTDSIRITLSERKNLIVATGTGSGKSFCFGIPIVNRCIRLRKEETPGVKAVIIYPMNALANSQYDDFARRLKGTGVTIARYTGEVAHKPENALSQFQELYRREPYDCEIISRREIQQSPPDILMTNYVQLELLLTRLEDKQIFRDSHLEFVVLDEIHMYGGKRGTDVALLLRRLKQRTGTIGNVCCIGTSATMHSDDAEEEPATVAAEFAQKLFGEPFDGSCYVAETEEHLAEHKELRSLPDSIQVTRKMVDEFDENSPKSLQELASSLCRREVPQSDVEPQVLYELLSGHPTLHFLEHQLSEGPIALNELTERYILKWRKGTNPASAQAELEAALILGSLARSPDESGKLAPRFMPKLHTFFTQGKELRRCLAPDCHFLDDRGATTCPSSSKEGKPAWLFPIHFCRVCGQDYYGFGVSADGTAVPFSIYDEELPANPGYFMLRKEEPRQEVLPENWLTPGGKVRKDFQKHIPSYGFLDLKNGVFDRSGDGVEGIWLPVPFLWCPNCDMTYDRVPREFSKLFLLNTIGRATGANVLIQGTMLESPENERKIIAFSDNRQDTAFQSGHLNDWFQRIFFRRLLVTTLREGGHVEGMNNPLELTSAGITLYSQMERSDTLPKTAVADEYDEYGFSELHFKEYLTYCVLREMESSPKFTTLNAESVGLLQVVYNGLGKLAADERLWTEVPVLKDNDPSIIKEYLQGLLDIMRKQLALAHRSLTNHADFTINYLRKIPEQFYYFPEPPGDKFRNPVVFSDDPVLKKYRRRVNVKPLFTSHRFLNWTRRIWDVDRGTAVTILERTFENFRLPEVNSFVTEFSYSGGKGKLVNPGRMRLQMPESLPSQICPKCNDTYRWKTLDYCVNPRCGRLRPYEHRTNYYLHYYSPGMADLFPLRATSHSGMVGGKDRRQREIEFRKPDGMYNVMVATPTMELGIDIGDLSSVYLRNVPPNPANYAQRTGRAGRSGQGALSVAFCGSGPGRGSHDQYFYRFPEKIVSGSISVPRFNLDNKTLMKAHVNSLVLQTIDVKLQNRADYVLEIQEDGHKKEPLYPMKLDYKQSIEREVERQRIRVHEAVKEAFESETLDRPWFSDEFIFGAIDEFTDTLDRAFDPWRIDYRDTAQELEMKQAQQFKEPTEQLKYAAGHLAKRLQIMREGKDRFNVYNYLRHVGFLPNYAFPRSDVVLKFSDSSDDIHRDRLIGLSEFAPMNTVYYEGGKHMVKTAFMDEKSKLIKIKVCTSCTTVMRGDLTKGSICPSCGSSLEVVHASEALQLPNMKAIRRERITADEEERLRRGFKIAHTYIPGNNVRSLVIKRNDSPIATLSFERTADLLHVNMGPFSTLESPEERPGFFLCRACGNWLSSRQIEKHYDTSGRDYCYRGGEKKELLSQLQLFVESAHDVLTFEPVADFVAGDVDSFATTLLYALQRGICLALDLDSSELDGFLQNVGNGKRRVVIYETAEGGTGTLQSILSVESLRRIAENILELIHYEPDGSESDGACERACYDCLCTFYNQREHRLLHRAHIRDFLGLLSNATSLVGKPSEDERYKQMYEESNRGERKVLEALREAGYRIPDEHHKIIYDHDIPLIESDFYYEPNIVVLVHGSIHHLKYVRDMDQDKEAKVQSLGYIVVVVEPNNIENLISLYHY